MATRIGDYIHPIYGIVGAMPSTGFSFVTGFPTVAPIKPTNVYPFMSISDLIITHSGKAPQSPLS